MFGYVRPVLNLLEQEEKDLYQSAYCGLCHTMGKRHGFFARFTLNYDFAFLAILFSEGSTLTHCSRRCLAHPFRKKKACVCGRGMDAAADASMILMWQKLRDDVLDQGLLRGLPKRFLCRFFSRAYERAKTAMPELEARVTAGLQQLHELEAQRSGQLDRAADAFAGILMAAAPECPGESRRRVLEQMLYHIGRWIYLTDAWDDLEEDRKAGRYNPIESRFAGKCEENREYLATSMTHSLKLAISAANLEDFGVWWPVVENTLYRGLPTVQEAVLNGRWAELKKQKSSREKRE